MTPARLHALHAIDQRDLPGWPAGALPRVRAVDLRDERDVDLSERIVVGVVKHLLSLRHAIEVFSDRPIDRVDVAAQKILAVALEQLRELDRVPPHAVVDDAVEQCKHVGPRGASGFVNAVLRKAATSRGRFELGSLDAATQAEREHSVPRETFARLAKLYGDAAALELCDGFNREPPTLARLIGDSTIDAVRTLGIDAVPHTSPGVVVLANVRRSQLRALADANVAQVQDATSVETIADLDLQPGHRVLDRCCGRGTKTRQLLERVGVAGRVTAMDTSLDRIASLCASQATAIAGRRLRVVHAGSVGEIGSGESFDRVLVDAPCSNSGVFARRPEARYRQSPRDVRDVIRLQSTILDDSATVVAPGGLLEYATCSIWPEENERVVEVFLRRVGGFERVSERRIDPAPSADPTRYRDGGFASVLRRR